MRAAPIALSGMGRQLGPPAVFTQLRMACRYQDHVKTVLTRVNSINGYVYSEDPTIFAWELINEPRVDATSPPGVIAVHPPHSVAAAFTLSAAYASSSLTFYSLV